VTSARTSLLVAISALILGAACGAKLNSALTGRWENSAAKTTWEFKSDGSVRVWSKDSNGQEQVLTAGNYRVIDEHTLELKWEGRTDTVNVEFSPTGELKIAGRGLPPMTLTKTS
jgi:hypothetical protein